MNNIFSRGCLFTDIQGKTKAKKLTKAIYKVNWSLLFQLTEITLVYAFKMKYEYEICP